MKWEMENEGVETVLERIWDLHDKLSDVIHLISRTQFLGSIRLMKKKNQNQNQNQHPLSGSADEDPARDGNGNGFVYCKDYNKESAVAEAKSLNAIRSALENLEEQLEFFHTVQMQQKAERDAALTRLEQSRIILALRLGEHHGKRYKVIEEALDFVGDVQEGTCCFISPEDLCGPSTMMARVEAAALQPKGNSNFFVRFLLSGLGCAKNALKLDTLAGVVGNAALLTISMLAMVHIQRQASCKNKYNPGIINPNKDRTQVSYRFDVLSARG
ncbi:hypothetical protein Dimus_028193 [Dionaea muscipula]